MMTDGPFPISVDLGISYGFHGLAVLILLIKFLTSSSTKGVSGKTQFLYTLVFCTRYLSIVVDFVGVVNHLHKLFFMLGSLMAVLVIYFVVRDYSEIKYDTFRIEILVIPVTLLATYLKYNTTVLEAAWAWSVFMEAVALIPQFHMSARGGHVDLYIVSYVTSLLLYRGFYIYTWYSGDYMEGYDDNIASVCGMVQFGICALGLILLLSKYCECCCFSDELSNGKKNPSIYTLPFVTQGFPRDYNLIRSEKSLKHQINNGPYSHDLSVPILSEEENA